jgi:hypothetical protein
MSPGRPTLLPPDIATCDTCRGETFEPGNRRHPRDPDADRRAAPADLLVVSLGSWYSLFQWF